MLELKNISYAYAGAKPILHNISCRLDKTECVTLIGHNGAGKSTFFDLISGRITPQEGTILLNGQDITGWSEQQRAGLIGRLFQNPLLNTAPSMTVKQNIQVTLSKGRLPRLGRYEPSESFYDQLQEMLPFNLRNHLALPAWSLSGGQRQLLSFALLVQTKPALLLLDEPTASLDTHAATELLKQVVRLHDVPVILITHNPLIAQHIGNKLWCLEAGTIKYAYGIEKRHMPVQELMKEIDLESIRQ